MYRDHYFSNGVSAVPKTRMILDLAGKKFDRLTVVRVLSKEEVVDPHVHWECLCDCGNTVVRRQDYILKRPRLSCGCGNLNHTRVGSKHHLWTGHGEITGEYISVLRHAAKNRGHVFEVTMEALWELFQAQDGRCALSGLPISFTPSYSPRLKKEQTASLDRIDATIGYVLGNVQWVHKDVNKMKNVLDQDYFIDLCEAVTSHQKRSPGSPALCLDTVEA